MTKIKYNLLRTNNSNVFQTLKVAWFCKAFVFLLIIYYLIYANCLFKNETKNSISSNTKFSSNQTEYSNLSGDQYVTDSASLKEFKNDESVTSTLKSSNYSKSASISMTDSLLFNTNITIMQAIEANRQSDNEKYFINTSKCHIPYVDPFTSELLAFYKPPGQDLRPNCTHDEAIIEVHFDEEHKHYTLHINYYVAHTMLKNKTLQDTQQDLKCCYKDIIRTRQGGNVDSSYKLLPCIRFHQNFIVPRHISGIIVQCSLKSTQQILQSDAFSFIQVAETKTKKAESTSSGTKLKRKVSLLLIGIDTLSRINVRRTMPKTVNYLKTKKWFELKGYTKLGDNTFPNLMPFMTGYTKATVIEKCTPREIGGLDKCNFIWTRFKEQGYKTAYAEDTYTMSTFNYLIRGFEKPPTDYYFRPFSMAIEGDLKSTEKAGLKYCTGRKSYAAYVYDYAAELAKRYPSDPYFGLFWTNSFSHNDFEVSATMDASMMEYFQDLEKHNVFESSIVIFFSDHGSRSGRLVHLTEGYLEERLPMIFISLPKWFQAAYPDLIENFRINQKRLTTAFDVQMTMQHILKLSNSSYDMVPALDCANAHSLFQQVAENRTCDQACIPETWCTCAPFKVISKQDETVAKITQLVVDKMNQYFIDKNITSACAALAIKNIESAQLQYEEEPKMLVSGNDFSLTYRIDFKTNPKTDPEAAFSATVDYYSSSGKISLNVEDISRHSKYENTAKCIDDKVAKKYCICRNSVIKDEN